MSIFGKIRDAIFGKARAATPARPPLGTTTRGADTAVVEPISGVEDPLAVRYTIDKLGIDNVMWAIDYPYHPMEPAVRFIEDFECTDAERHALCHGNAERVFHIDAS